MNRDEFSNLTVEALEERQLLSSVQVFADGSMGDEAFDLQVGGETVLQVENIHGGGVFEANIGQNVSANDIRIVFTNDAWDPSRGIDRNLIIDKISIDGQVYQTEDPSTASTGTWNGSGFSYGNYQSEWLHSGGYFQFADGNQSQGGGTTVGQGSKLIQVRARGDIGGENMRVIVNGQQIASIDVATSWQKFDIYTDLYSRGDDVRIEYTNDRWDPANGIDSNLQIDYVIADGIECQTEAPSTFGFGTWNNGFAEDFHQSETLNANGYFKYKFSDPGPQLGGLNGRYFIDQNNNNQDDNQSEPGVAGVNVMLLDANGNATGRQTFTGPNGYYQFDDLTPGQYGVKFTDNVSGRVLIDSNVGSDFNDSDAINQGNGVSVIRNIAVTAGKITFDNDAGVELAPTDTAPTKLFEQEVIVRNAYNNGRGKTVVLDLSDGIRDEDGDNLTYKLDFADSFFVQGRRDGIFGWEVLSFDENTGELTMQVFTEDEEAWHYDGREVSSVFVQAPEDKDGANGQQSGIAYQPFEFTVHDQDGNSLRCQFGLQVFDTHYSSPIALDLNVDGVIGVTGEHTAKNSTRSSIGQTVAFDIDADGNLDQIEWFAGDGDGILVDASKIGPGYELNGDALFGDQGGQFSNGYEKLQLLDSNSNGELTGSELSVLALWVDDGNAKLERGELHSLESYSIVSVSTEMQLDGEGRMRSAAGLQDGSNVMSEDVWFAQV